MRKELDRHIIRESEREREREREREGGRERGKRDRKTEIAIFKHESEQKLSIFTRRTCND